MCTTPERLVEQTSRFFKLFETPYDWKINPVIFHRIDNMFGPHTVDRFAALHNQQLQRYNSMFMDPETEGVDALAQNNWHQEMNFCNAPFWMVSKILQKLKTQKAEATVIAPWWPIQT